LMKTADRVIELLYDRVDGYWPVDELARAAGLNVRKLSGVLKALAADGVGIETSPSSGVRLARPVRLNAHLIERSLSTSRVGRNVICFQEVESTNDVAFDCAMQDGSDGLAILAESQRRGRGRLGRRWISSPGDNVLASVLLADPDERLPHEALTIAAGLAVAEAVEGSCGLGELECRLKWPNDVLLDDRKVAGVLVEIKQRLGRDAGASTGRAVVVGIGVNVNSAPPEGQVDRPAACLADHLGHPVERIGLVRAMLERLDDWAGRIASGDYAGLHEAWLRRCDMLNRRVRVLSGGEIYEGRLIDISPLEGLTLCHDSGQRITLRAENSSMVD